MRSNEPTSRSFLMFCRGIEIKYWLKMIKQIISHHCVCKTLFKNSKNKVIKQVLSIAESILIA